MNLESEVKIVLREEGNPEEKADRICRFTNFRKEDVISAIKKGGRKVSDIYKTLLVLDSRQKFKAKGDKK